jgi:hypothetical protein
VAERVKGVVRGLDPGLWNSANATTRGAWVRLLGEVVQSQFLAPTTLAWVEGPAKAEGRTTFETWPLPGGTNAGHAAESWSARGQLLALHPTLATSGEVAGLLRDTGCRQVELRWPRLGSGPLPTAEEMALWLSACLPSSVPGASVTARLGAWPEAGWTREDFQEIERSSKPGGVLALRDPAKVGHPRLQEIALLAMVLRNPTLRDLQVQVRVILPPEDGPPGKEAVLATRAQGWASRIGALLRGAAELPLAVQEEGLVDDDPLVTARDPATLDQSQLRRLADLNRRVELVLSRGGGLEPDEASPEVPAPPPPATTPSSP